MAFVLQYLPRRIVKLRFVVISVFIGVFVCLLWILYTDTERGRSSSSAIQIAVVEEHHEVLVYWMDAVKYGVLARENVTVLHIDGHADDAAPEFHPHLPFFHWPQTPQQEQAMLQKNDIFIQVAAMIGLLHRFVWIFPDWLDDQVEYTKETNELGYFMHGEKDQQEPYFCECHVDRSRTANCMYYNFSTPILSDSEIELDRDKCLLKAKYSSETLQESFAADQIMPRLKNNQIDVLLGSKVWLKPDEAVIWDIDLDYFGCELPGDQLVNAGMTWRVVELIDRKLEPLFCPFKLENEVQSNGMMQSLIHIMITNCAFDSRGKCTISFKRLQKLTQEKLIEFWKSSPRSFCPGNDLRLRNVWKDIAFIFYHLKLAQLLALQAVGFCFNFSPKTFGAADVMSVSICHGLNEPDSQFVQKYVPSLEDIMARLARLERIMNLLPAPNLVTICRSSRDGYVPRKYVKVIEDRVIKAIKTSHKTHSFNVIYDEDLMGGVNGWETGG